MDIAIICSFSVILRLTDAFVPIFFAASVDPELPLRDWGQNELGQEAVFG